MRNPEFRSELIWRPCCPRLRLTEEEHEADGNVGLSPPRSSKRGTNVRNLGPVEREETHSEAVVDAEKLVDGVVVRRDPADCAIGPVSR